MLFFFISFINDRSWYGLDVVRPKNIQVWETWFPINELGVVKSWGWSVVKAGQLMAVPLLKGVRLVAVGQVSRAWIKGFKGAESRACPLCVQCFTYALCRSVAKSPSLELHSSHQNPESSIPLCSSDSEVFCFFSLLLLLVHVMAYIQMSPQTFMPSQVGSLEVARSRVCECWD